MGKRIKSTGFILDASSTGSAPVSPSGTVALRAKSDSTQFQYSANGGAWTDFGGGGAGGTLTGKWLWSNATTGAPATGVVAINNAAPSAATEIRIHETSNESAAFAGSFDLVIPGSHIYVQDADDATRWVRYNVTAPGTDHGDYRHWPVSLVSYGGVNLNNGEVVNLQFLSSGSGAIPRLDEVLDPTANASFEMGNHQLVFHFTAGEAEENVVFESLAPGTSPAGGPIVLIRASGSATEKAPLRIETRGTFAMSVAADGKVAIGAETGLVHKLNVYHTNTGGTNVGALHASVTLGAGNTAVSMTGSELRTSDAGNTTALLAMKNLELNLERESSAIANGFMVGTIVSANAEINIFTGTVRGLTLGIGVHNSAIVSTWEAIRITAPSTFGGGIVETKRAIITEAGAGFTGLGTLTPSVQLHVVGAMHDEQTTGQVFTIAKTHNTETPQLDFKRTQATGLYLGHNDVAGRIMFYGWFSPAWKALGYVHTTFDTTFGNAGMITMGAGDFGNARVEVLQTDTGTGGVTIRGAATAPWFSVTSVGHLFSHGATGSIYYRDAAGYFVNLDIFSHPTDPDDEGKVLTVYNVSGVLLPRWRAGGVGGGTPADPVNTLQYNAAGNFGAVASSVVSGANVTLGGIFTVVSGGQTLAVDPTATDLIMTFSDVVGSPTQMGYIKSYWDGTYSGGRLDLGAGAVNDLARITMLDTGATAAITLYGSTAMYFQVQTAGFQFSGSTNGAMWYTNSLGYFVPTASPASADNIPFWDNSAGQVRWLTVGTGLLITDTTITAVGGAALAGGTNLQVQYNNATALGGITGFEVSATGGVPNMVLGGGYFQIAASLTASVPNINQEFFISATTAAPTRFVMRRYSSNPNDGSVNSGDKGGYIEFDKGRGTATSPSNVLDGDTVGAFVFKGYLSGLTQMGWIRSWYDGTYGGGRLDLGAGAQDDFARITMLDTGTTAAITLFGSSSYYFQVQTAGYLFNGGANGTLWYTNSAGYFVPTSTPPAADRIAFWDASAGTVTWLTAGSGLTITGTTMTASGGGGGTPAGSGSELQYNSSGAFGAVNTSGVTAAGWVGIGTTTPSVRLHVVGGCVLEASSFIFQVQTAGFYFSSGSTGSVYYKDSFGYFVPTAAGTTSQYLKGGSAPFWGSIDATHITSGTLPLARGGTGSGMIDPNADRILFWDDSAGVVDWLIPGTGLTISGTTMTASGGGGGTPAGSGSELQYRNAGAFGAVLNSTVDGSGNVVLGSGVLAVQSSASGAALWLKSASTTVGPTIYTERSRGTLTSKGQVLAGDALLTMANHGYDNTLALRQGLALDVIAQANWTTTSAPTSIRIRTTPVNSITPAGRLILGASKVLAHNTLTELFRLTYTNTAEHSGMAGEIHLVFVVKGFHSVTQTQVYKRKIKFAMFHTANNLTGFAANEDTSAAIGIETGGATALNINHGINLQAHPGQAISDDIVTASTGTNEVIYKVLFETQVSTIYSIVCYYNIFYHGENELAMAASV